MSFGDGVSGGVISRGRLSSNFPSSIITRDSGFSSQSKSAENGGFSSISCPVRIGDLAALVIAVAHRDSDGTSSTRLWARALLFFTSSVEHISISPRLAFQQFIKS